VTLGLQEKWSRLSQMGWEELRTRVAQAAGKRLDLACYRAGVRPRPGRLLQPAPRTVKFFFSSAELAKRIALLREHLPQEVESIVREADGICRHEVDLLGYEKLNYGPDIDWHLDAVHGKRAPLKPWFKIDFLNFSEVGDHKVIWELNRHQHLVTLAKAWRLSNDRGYADELRAQWYSWQKSNPYPLGVNWASALEVAFRSLSWLWIRQLMAGCDSFPATFGTDLLRALQRNGRYIERYLSTYFSPNTHLLGEAVALFFIGTLCPEIPIAERWRQAGWNIVLNEAKRQVRPDGVYFEQALYYHVYALDFFLHARTLAALNDTKIPAEFDAVLRKMLDFVHALSQAGAPGEFGDDDGGRVFNPRRNRVEHMTDPLAIGAALYESEKYASAGALTEEAVWLFGEQAVGKFESKTPRPIPCSRVFDSGGIYLLADSEPCPQLMMVDGGPQGIGHSSHGHADALSLQFSVDGQGILVDPGSYVYISDDDARNLFRGTGAHNTLKVDGIDQAIPEGPFAWSSIPRVQAERWLAGETFELFIASHDGYRRLPDPVVHRRMVFHAKGGFWLVRDMVEGQQPHLLQSFWHFAPGLMVTEEAGTITVTRPESLPDGDPAAIALALLPVQSPAWTTELRSGLVSPAYGATQPAPVVCFSATVPLPSESAVLLVPLTRATKLGKFASIQESGPSAVRAYRYDVARSTRYIFLGGNGSWRCGPWSSDASLLYCALEDGRLEHVVMVSGSYARWQDKQFIVHPTRVERFEWVAGDGGTKTFSSDRAALEHAEIDFEFLDPVL
jgi:hypothetical protein